MCLAINLSLVRSVFRLMGQSFIQFTIFKCCSILTSSGIQKLTSKILTSVPQKTKPDINKDSLEV